MKLLASIFLLVSMFLAFCAGCGSTRTECIEEHHMTCRGGEVFWVDSCDVEGAKVADCECGCDKAGTSCRVPCDCVPDCAGRECGVDGCGGNCPPGCLAGAICDQSGLCVPCTPACSGKECGDDGCGGTCGPGCQPIETCSQAGQCVPCSPDCSGRECGDDGCGGLCLPGCAAFEFCEPGGRCAACSPECAGKECGPGVDSCGNAISCGDCGSGFVCGGSGLANTCAPLPDGVLIYWGHAGIGPAGIYGFCTHFELVAIYEASGLTIDYTDLWPTSLDAYRLVVLAVPGSYDEASLFTPAEVDALASFLSRGGVLVVENEKDYYSGTPVINDLLSRLGSSIRQEDALFGTGGANGIHVSDLPDHDLLGDVGTLAFWEGSKVLPGSATCLVVHEGDCALAAETIGSGFLVVTGDQQFLDDWGLEHFPPDGADNLIFAGNLARSN